MALGKAVNVAKFFFFSLSLLFLSVTFLSLQLSFIWTSGPFMSWVRVTVREEQFRANWDAKAQAAYAGAAFPAFVRNETEWTTRSSLDCTLTGCNDALTGQCSMGSAACMGAQLRLSMSDFDTAYFVHEFGTERLNIDRALFNLEAESDYINTVLNVDDHFGGNSAAFGAVDRALTAQILFSKKSRSIVDDRRDAANRASQAGNTAALFGTAAALLTLLVWLALLLDYQKFPMRVFSVVAVLLSFLGGLAAVGIQDSISTYSEASVCTYKVATFELTSTLQDLAGGTPPVEYGCSSEADWRWAFWMIWLGWTFGFLGMITIFAEPLVNKSAAEKEAPKTAESAPGTAV